MELSTSSSPESLECYITNGEIKDKFDLYTSPLWPESKATFSAKGLPSESVFKPMRQIAIPLQVATAMISYGLNRVHQGISSISVLFFKKG